SSTRTPPRYRTLPTSVAWTSKPSPTLIADPVTPSDPCDGGMVEDEPLGPSEVVGRRDLEVDRLARDDPDAIPRPLQERRVVRAHHARLGGPGVGVAQGRGRERLRCLGEADVLASERRLDVSVADPLHGVE